MKDNKKHIQQWQTSNCSITPHTYRKYQIEVKTTAVDKANLHKCKHMYHYTKAPLIRASMHEYMTLRVRVFACNPQCIPVHLSVNSVCLYACPYRSTYLSVCPSASHIATHCSHSHTIYKQVYRLCCSTDYSGLAAVAYFAFLFLRERIASKFLATERVRHKA